MWFAEFMWPAPSLTGFRNRVSNPGPVLRNSGTNFKKCVQELNFQIPKTKGDMQLEFIWFLQNVWKILMMYSTLPTQKSCSTCKLTRKYAIKNIKISDRDVINILKPALDITSSIRLFESTSACINRLCSYPRRNLKNFFIGKCLWGWVLPIVGTQAKQQKHDDQQL